MNITAQTDVGQRKGTNEDAIETASFGSTHLLVVADGMGGHAAGDVASELATTTISETVSTAIDDGRTDYEAMLNEALVSANDAILDEAEATNAQRSMGTTAVTAIVEDETAIIANVGDSRAYRVNDELTQITTDQSFVQELIDEGEITPEEAKTHPQRHVLSQALGTEESVNPDFSSATVEDRVLLCSDGLTEEVSEKTIAEILHEASDIKAAGKELIQRANENGGSDNISVIIADV
jgi:protein phosphatase